MKDDGDGSSLLELLELEDSPVSNMEGPESELGTVEAKKLDFVVGDDDDDEEEVEVTSVSVLGVVVCGLFDGGFGA